MSCEKERKKSVLFYNRIWLKAIYLLMTIFKKLVTLKEIMYITYLDILFFSVNAQWYSVYLDSLAVISVINLQIINTKTTHNLWSKFHWWSISKSLFQIKLSVNNSNRYHFYKNIYILDMCSLRAKLHWWKLFFIYAHILHASIVAWFKEKGIKNIAIY